MKGYAVIGTPGLYCQGIKKRNSLKRVFFYSMFCVGYVQKFSVLCATFLKSLSDKFLHCLLTLNMKTKSLSVSIFYLSIVTVFILLLNSCAPAKNVVYFQNLQKDTTLQHLVNNNMELKIRKNDLLSISIISPDPVSTPLFNAITGPSASNSAASSSSLASGYLVDNDGNILMYKLGVIHVEGLTRSELKDKLQKDLSPYLIPAVWLLHLI